MRYHLAEQNNMEVYRWFRIGATRVPLSNGIKVINANPLRPEQLHILLTILTNTFQSNQWILDLGYGSGQIEKLIFERIPQAKIVGVDNSDAMMQLAHKRLGTYEHQFGP